PPSSRSSTTCARTRGFSGCCRRGARDEQGVADAAGRPGRGRAGAAGARGAAGDHLQGPPRAPLTIVEYGDYECPRSGRAHAVLQIVLHELGDGARFVFRNFPLTDPHPRAQPAAEAAESVAAHGGEDAFWAMHDILFSNQDALETDDLIAYAEAVAADPQTVADDLATRAFADR